MKINIKISKEEVSEVLERYVRGQIGDYASNRGVHIVPPNYGVGDWEASIVDKEEIEEDAPNV